MTAATYHRARRDYEFRLEPANVDRCASCIYCRWVLRGSTAITTGRAECPRLDIIIADPKRSRCELYTEAVI